MQETQVQSRGWKDTLEQEMATCSSILAWEIPSETEQQRSLMAVVHESLKESDTTWWLNHHHSRKWRTKDSLLHSKDISEAW